MSDELTPGEKAEVENYVKDLGAEIGAMDDVELGMLAKRAEVDASKYPERKDLVAAIELKAEADFARGKIELRKMDDDARQRVLEQGEKLTPLSRTLRAMNFEFSSCVSHPVQMFAVPDEPTKDDLKLIGHWIGSYVPNGDSRFSGEVATKDGKYRVAGSPFVFEIKGKRVAAIHAANPKNEYCGSSVISVE